jgi:hypothetical protein
MMRDSKSRYRQSCCRLLARNRLLQPQPALQVRELGELRSPLRFVVFLSALTWE